MLEIKIKYFNKEVPRLAKIEKGDWIDLYITDVKLVTTSSEKINMLYDLNKPFKYDEYWFLMFGTGVAMQLPNRYEAHVIPRSGTFKKYGLIQTNHMGLIDNSYCGDNDQWFLPMYALRPGEIKKYDRIAQFRIVEKMEPVIFTEVTKLGNLDRNGWGSTGR